MKPTEKLYYSNPDLLIAQTQWLHGSQPDKVIILASPAFPEGGGQEGDHGVLRQGNLSIPFLETQKSGAGRKIIRQDFPTISVDHQVELTLASPLPEGLDLNLPVEVIVDANRRQALSRSHTAAHLLWMALTQRYGNLYPVVRGCHIAEQHGRFDLLIDKPTDKDLRDAEEKVLQLVNANHAIEMVALPDEPECRIWRSAGSDIPCGGTHLTSTNGVGPVVLRVKNKGKSGWRVSYELLAPMATS